MNSRTSIRWILWLFQDAVVRRASIIPDSDYTSFLSIVNFMQNLSVKKEYTRDAQKDEK